MRLNQSTYYKDLSLFNSLTLETQKKAESRLTLEHRGYKTRKWTFSDLSHFSFPPQKLQEKSQLIFTRSTCMSFGSSDFQKNRESFWQQHASTKFIVDKVLPKKNCQSLWLCFGSSVFDDAANRANSFVLFHNPLAITYMYMYVTL